MSVNEMCNELETLQGFFGKRFPSQTGVSFEDIYNYVQRLEYQVNALIADAKENTDNGGEMLTLPMSVVDDILKLAEGIEKPLVAFTGNVNQLVLDVNDARVALAQKIVRIINNYR